MTPDGFVSDPYASDKPKFTITAQNFEQYKDNLTPGQIAMLALSDSYRLPVHETRRSAAMPQHVYDAAARNATQTNMVRGGNGLENFEKAVAFDPQGRPGSRLEPHHRYRGGSARRVIAQATPQVNGSFSLVKFVDEVVYTDTLTDYNPDKHGNVLFYLSSRSPSRPAWPATCCWYTRPRPGEGTAHGVDLQRRPAPYAAPRRSPMTPGHRADGLRTSDNLDMFNGAPDRYDWKLIGKKEVYIPYNSTAWIRPS